jgi:hypothetical protein
MALGAESVNTKITETMQWGRRVSDSTAFLQRVEKNLTSQVLQLGDLFSVTALLNTWEMSIRKACAPPSSASL